MKNITKLIIGVAAFAAMMIFPPTKMLILFLLPLGSGIDDLLFFAALFVLAALLLIRCAPVENPIKALAKWMMK